MLKWFETLSEPWKIAIFTATVPIGLAALGGIFALIKWLCSCIKNKPHSKKIDRIHNKFESNNDRESGTNKPEKIGDDSEDRPFDVFLSHSHVDKDVVEQLGVMLKEKAGFRVWLDKWVLVPGKHFVREIAKGLDNAKTCAVCIGRKTPSGWFKEEIERALNRQIREPSFRVIPVILPGGDESLIDGFLELRTWVRFIDGIDDTSAFYDLSCGIKGIPRGKNPAGLTGSDSELQSVRKDLVKIKSLRGVIDDEIAFEYQRKLLDRLFDL